MNHDKTLIFQQQRRRLMAIAYRLLGSVADAEDVLQEAWLRWETQDLALIESPDAYLTTVVTRLGIDHLRRERHRTRYVGPWLPEPWLMEPSEDVDGWFAEGPAATHERYQSISMAFLVLLERLNPVERAVYLLKEVFGHNYEEISAIVDKTIANCRQIDHRARTQLGFDRARYEYNPHKHQQLLSGFIQAMALGDLAALQNVLTDDVVLTSDGGGKALSVLRPLHGSERIGRFFRALRRRYLNRHVGMQLGMLNGEPALLILVDDVVESVVMFDWRDDRIGAIFILRNPDKLQRLKSAL